MRHIRLLASPLLLLASGQAIAGPNAEFEAEYQKRFETLMRDRGVFLKYDPMEVVPGAKVSRPMRIAKKPSIAPAVLDAALAYAKSNNSTAFLVWRDGTLQSQAYFGGNDWQTPLVSKSLSKPLTAIAIGRAIRMGKIKSLDQPISDFLPEWKDTPKQAILVRHLIDMRSGLLEQMFSADPNHPINRVYIHPDHGRELIENYPLTHEPGSHYGYNNATSELVALVIERATGRRYAEFVGNEILKPIGAAGGKIWINRPGGLAHSGCCMLLPAESWLRMGILLAQDGKTNGRRLLPEGYVKEMRTGTPQNPHYGLGVWLGSPYLQRRGFAAPDKPGPKVLHSEPYLDPDLFLFDGNTNQVVYILPKSKMVILRMGNLPPLEPEWDNAKLPNILVGGVLK
jgi:CubicO group peptidase (beta-lactamase class C family)